MGRRGPVLHAVGAKTRGREFRFIFHDLLIRIEKSAKLREMVLLKYIVDC